MTTASLAAVTHKGKQSNALGNLLSEARERVLDVINHKEETTFAKSVEESFWMFLPYMALSIPIEIAINKAIIPSLNNFLKKVTGNQEAEMPQIAQSIFKGLGLFAWFPALLMANSTKRFFKYEDEVVEPEVRGRLINGIANTAIFRPDVSQQDMEISLKDAADNPVTALIDIIYNQGSTTLTKKLAEVIQKAGDGDERRAFVEMAEAIVEELRFAKKQDLIIAGHVVEHTKGLVSKIMESVKPSANAGFIQRVMQGENASADDIQSALMVVYGLLFDGFKSEPSTVPLKKMLEAERNHIIREVRDVSRVVDDPVHNAKAPADQLEAWRQVASIGLEHIMRHISEHERGAQLKDGALENVLEGMLGDFRYQSFTASQSAGVSKAG